MAVQIQFRRGNTAQHSVFTGVVGEVTVDTDKDVLVVHDGSTVGGFPLAPIFTYDLANASYIQANTATTVATASFGKANDTYDIAVAAFGAANNSSIGISAFDQANTAYNQANTAKAIASAAFDTANNSSIGIAAFDQANVATSIATSSFDKVNAVAIGANSYADSVGAGVNAWATATFTTITVGTAAFDKANAATTIGSSAYDQANSANVLAYNTGIGANAYSDVVVTSANAFASATIAGANAAVGAGANAFTSATIAGANTAVGAGANAYADVVGTSANTYLLTVIAGANAAVGAGANTVGSAAFDKANTAETIAIAAYSNSNTKLATSGGTITGDLAIVGNLAVSGNTSYISVQNYRVDDPLIYLAGNNYVSDIVDIGFIGNYVNTTGQNVHTGLFRNHEDKEYYLFYGYDQEPENNHIDPNGNNFTVAVLNADLKTSNLVLGGQNAITWISTVYDKANSANVLAYETGIGANAFASATIAGANTAVGTGANAYADVVGTSANAYLLNVITGANTAVGSGANSYADTVGSSANAYLLNVIAGANTSVGAGANTVGSAAFTKANGAVQTGFVTIAANGTNVVADSNNDTLTLTASQNIAIVGNATTDEITFDLANTGVIASTYGGATAIPVLIVDEKGRITGVSNVAVVIPNPGGGYFIGNRGEITSENFGDIFRVHSNTLTANVTVYSGNNSIAAGPITIGAGGKLTIQDGARVSIV